MVDVGGVQEIVRDSMDEIKSELFRLYGCDYTIVHHFEVPKKGFLGFGRKGKQVLAKYKVKPRNVSSYSSESYTNTEQGQDFLLRTAVSQEKDEEDFRMNENREKILASQTSTILNAQMKQMTEVQNKLDELTASLNKNIYAGNSEKHQTIARIEELLSDNEFSFAFIGMITDKIRRTFSLEQMENFEMVERTVIDWIGETIEVELPQHVRPPLVKVIVGPTGVGKTTTLVKMVAKCIIKAKDEGRSFEARLITTDFTRVGAEEQLKHFGEILKREVIKAETMDDLKEIYEANRAHCDGIFIDTGGYSPNDSVNIAKLKNILTVPGFNPQIHLAFDAKTKCSDIKNIMNNYEPFAYNSVIVTKCDESTRFGNIISALYEKHKKISYVTFGQSAAKNISVATPLYFLEKLSGFNLDIEHLKEKFSISEDY